MKDLLLQLCLFSIAASVASAAVPPLNVTVSDSAGKTAFKGTTKSEGDFATAKLPPGNYVVQFKATNSAVKNGQYSIVVGAGKKKVVANALAGEKFLGGGVAMKVEVGAGLNIAGQVVLGPTVTNSSVFKDKLGRLQDQAQDTHQGGFQESTSNVQGKMIRP